MVIIQPFEYEKTTAFKERVQIANKVNEIIDLFNELDIESKINIFNEEIEIINGKIAEIDSKIVEVDNAVAVVEGYNGRLTSVENRVTANESLSSDNKSRLDNLTPRVTATENKNVEQDGRINALENNSMLIKGSKSFLVPNAGGYLMGGSVPNTITTNNYVRLFRVHGYSQQDVTIYGTVPNNGLGYIHFIMGGSDQYDRSYLIDTKGTFLTIGNPFLVKVSVSGYNELWIKKTTAFTNLKIIILHSTTGLDDVKFLGDDTGLNAIPVNGDTHPITSETITGVTGFNH